ncbi:hypothetical protein MVEN_00185200 [Mycena venus]|uniref:Uncharacterized protein n=1 Tax=Mycena venus TaxID=2733690 RepID=A0A8H6YWY6_9AGAR|nr:hypothetical protein MVEN_00185200 [Mycena venus]
MRERIVITRITCLGSRTHRWSRAHVDDSFGWTRMHRTHGPSTDSLYVPALLFLFSPDRHRVQMHLLLVDPPHCKSTKVSAAVNRGGHGSRAIIVTRIPCCTRALLSVHVTVPTAVLVLGSAGRTALPQAHPLSGLRLSLGWSFQAVSAVLPNAFARRLSQLLSPISLRFPPHSLLSASLLTLIVSYLCMTHPGSSRRLWTLYEGSWDAA